MQSRITVPLLTTLGAIMAALLLALAVGGAVEGQEDQTSQAELNQQRPSPAKLRIYGAQWISPTLQDSYFATGKDLSSSIERAAEKCSEVATDCQPGVWVKNGWASFAVDVSGAWGTGWGRYLSSANTAAVFACESRGGLACEIEDSRRTGSYNPTSLTEGGLLPHQAGTGGSGVGTGSAPAPVTVTPAPTTVVTPAPVTTTTTTPPPL
jgi:uncharacterized protein DUF4189